MGCPVGLIAIVKLEIDEEVVIVHVEKVKRLLLGELMLINVVVALVPDYPSDDLNG
jgi:hypothetical protein